MQKIADDTELKAAAERAAKERNTSTRGEQSCSTAASDFEELAAEQQEQDSRAIACHCKSTHGQGLPTEASRKKLEDMKCQTQAAHGSLQPCSVLP